MAEQLVWISGASSGIGAALAEQVPFTDARLIGLSRSPGPGNVEHVPVDLTDPDAWAAVEAHFLSQMGDFDGAHAVFVHCAGTIDPIGYAGEVDSDAYRRSVVLNSAAPQALGHAFLRAVAEWSGRAHLILISSGAATNPYEGWSSYNAGKAAVDQWVRTAGAEQASRGRDVTVLAVAPGTVDTDMQGQIRKMDERDFPAVGKFLDKHEQGELTDPAEAARGIWSLLDRDLDSGTVLDLREL